MSWNQEQIDANMGLIYINSAGISYYNAIIDDLSEISITTNTGNSIELIELFKNKKDEIGYRLKHRDLGLKIKEILDIENDYVRISNYLDNICVAGIEFLKKDSLNNNVLIKYKTKVNEMLELISKLEIKLENLRRNYKKKLGNYSPYEY